MEKGKLFEIVLLGALLALLAIAVLSIYGGTDEGRSQWKLPINSTPYMYVGNEDRLLVFDDSSVFVIRPNGRLAWQASVPDGWSLIYRWESVTWREYGPDGSVWSAFNVESGPVFACANDTLYLMAYINPYEVNYHRDNNSGQYSTETRINPASVGEKLMAVKNGTVVWEKWLPVSPEEYDGVDNGRIGIINLETAGDRLYLLHSGNLTVFKDDGTLLIEIPDVSDPPAIDERGNIYCIEANRSPEFQYDLRQKQLPSSTVEAYSPDGELCWSKTIDGTIARTDLMYQRGSGIDATGTTQASKSECRSLPIYFNNTLIIPLKEGVTELDTHGNSLWSAHVGQELTPIAGTQYDSAGNVYLTQTQQAFIKYSGTPRLIYIVAPDGSDRVIDWPLNEAKSLVAADNGTGYFDSGVFNNDKMDNLRQLLRVNVTARNLGTGEDLWTFEVPVNHTTMVTVTEENIGTLLTDDWAIEKSEYYNRDHSHLGDDRSLQYKVFGENHVNVLPAGDVVYVSYYSFNYEYPVLPEPEPWSPDRYPSGYVQTPKYSGPAAGYPYVAAYNRSMFAYASGICALDRNGTFLWQKPTGSFVVGMAANNSTLYYGTQTGGIAAVALAAGVTVVAAALLFLHFFGAATVSRARSRLEQNENRLAILQLVKERPGSTMYEISRELDMNLGTMRYHLLILGINHKIREHKDGKYVRFFPGSQVFTDIELEVMSLLRREPIRRLMVVLCEKPGISNSEIASALGISESAVSNYMRELSTKGLVTKEVTAAGRVAYMIRKEHAEKIENVLTSTG